MAAAEERSPLHVVGEVHAALRRVPAVDLDRHPIEVGYSGGTVTLEGEVSDMRAKRRAVVAAGRVAGVSEVVDHLCVPVAAPMGDEMIRDHVRDALLEEPALLEHGIRVGVDGVVETVRAPAVPERGDIFVEVREGVVRLSGSVAGLGHRRLAGVLAWWIPGTRDVRLDLEVRPPEQDADLEITDAIRMVHEKDPFVGASHLRVTTVAGVVHLEGWVPSEVERDAAELDAWYVDGVRDVVNRIEAGR